MFHKFFGHLKTINHHKKLVFINCCRSGIIWQGIVHDLSKYSPEEFIPGVKYYQEGKRSPNVEERNQLGYSAAWLHHKGRNKHHFEYWNDYNPKYKKIMPVKMPAKYLVEMFCDRVAASKNYKKTEYTNSSPLEYFLNSTARKEGYIHPETEKALENLLRILAEKGEKAAFSKAKEIIKKGDY